MSFARSFSDKYSKSLMDKGIDLSKKFAKTDLNLEQKTGLK